MTALAVGSSVTCTPRDGGTIAIATNGGFGSVVVTPTGGASSTANFGPAPIRQVFGPYAEGATIVITNQSCNSLDYDAGAGGFDPSSVAITGGTIGGRAVSTLGAIRRSPTAVVIGNSIATQDYRTPTGAQWVQVGNGVFSQINARLKQHFKLLNVAGYSGQTSSTVLSNFAAQVAPYAPNFVFALGWIENDCAQNVSAPTVIANTQALLQQCAQIGAMLVITAATPGGTSFTTSAQAQSWITLNQALRSVVRDNPNVLLLRAESPYIDLTATYPAPLSGGYSDGSFHPYQRGASVWADLFAPQISSWIGGVSDPFDGGWFSGATGAAGLVANPFNQGSQAASGGLSGTVPAAGVTYSLGGTGTGVASVAARTDGYAGQWTSIAYTGPASPVYNTDRIRVNTANVSLSSAGLNIGDVVQGMWELDVSGSVAGLMGPQVFVIFTGSTGTYGRSYANYQNNGTSSTAPYLTTPASLQVQATPPLAIPVGTTGLQLFAEIHPWTSAAFTAKFGRHGFRVLDNTWY